MSMFWGDADQPLAINQIHPCVIGCVPSLIHHPDLEGEDPALFRLLQNTASHSGYQLRDDRRQSRIQATKSGAKWKHRKKWIPLILLSAGMVLPKSTHATEQPLANIKAFVKNLPETEPQNSPESFTLNRLTNTPIAQSIEDWQGMLLEILMLHWQPGENDPEDMLEQIRTLAGYYSQFPEVRSLLVNLRDLPWHMQYARNRYLTEVFGTKKAVHSARVHFDPASAAQLQFSDACIENTIVCVASPADVLLHELLHVHQVFSDPVRFIAQTTMANGSYPHGHETKTIELEQRLYRSMSAVDMLQRPLRSTHLGKSVAVRCFTCID